jgi:hypothetical protein
MIPPDLEDNLILHEKLSFASGLDTKSVGRHYYADNPFNVGMVIPTYRLLGVLPACFYFTSLDIFH